MGRQFIDIRYQNNVPFKVVKKSYLKVIENKELKVAHCFITRETIVNIEPVENA